ncbi:MAG: Asp23/Gls24 family envelope stress response protein [Chloroflexi bacterium]|nr:Asp23/Gls24 family envelope stress response protein [Chloroflexota bacterium]
MGKRLGAVRISPQVLATTARLAALSVPGVVSMHHDLSSGVDRWLRGKGTGEGVYIQLVDDAVSVDLYIVAAKNVNLYELGCEIQSRVARAIQEMVGMPVLAVNVHIEDVETSVKDEAS